MKHSIEVKQYFEAPFTTVHFINQQSIHLLRLLAVPKLQILLFLMPLHKL